VTLFHRLVGQCSSLSKQCGESRLGVEYVVPSTPGTMSGGGFGAGMEEEEDLLTR
jgi:hypothetical protein